MKNKNLFLISIIMTLIGGCSSQITTSTSSNNTNLNSSSIISSSSDVSNGIIYSSSTTNSSTTFDSSVNSSTTTIVNSTSTSTGGNIQVPSNLYEATIESNAPDYYQSVKGLKGEALKDALYEIIKGHTTYSYGSSINSYMKIYDADYDNPNNINLIYTGSASKNTTFNKEHVWAKSHGDFGTGKGPGSDLHNLRPCYNNLNSTRGNLDFAEGGNEITSYPSNYKTSSTFEPRDDFKGDVARTIFYMATRYEAGEGYLNLELEAPTDTKRYLDLSSGANGVHGNFDDLYKWATSGIDPVDNYEVKRNNIIYEDYQHNRNPFIDHPEFIIMIYDKNYNGPGALLDLSGQGSSETIEESVARVENLILNIGTVTLESESKIIEAEEAYNNLTTEAKKLVDAEIYQLLIEARETYEKLYQENIVNIVISLIDQIGEVTLESETKIIEAEEAYNNLSNEQKAQITNYEKLIEARETLDELLENAPKEEQVLYSGNFGKVSEVTSTYGEATFTLEGKPWYASKCYKEGEEFRLGHNKVATINNKFLDALGLSSVDGSSLEMNWDITNSNKITFIINGKYGTPNNVYILKSIDQGNTYTKCIELDYSESTTSYSYEGSFESSVRYALVVTGTKPRLKLGSVEISGLDY